MSVRPIVLVDGVARFKKNVLVRMLFDAATKLGYDMNELFFHAQDAAPEDWEEFYQLIGYSISGYNELSKVRNSAAKEANEACKAALDLPPGCRAHGCGMHGSDTDPDDATMPWSDTIRSVQRTDKTPISVTGGTGADAGERFLGGGGGGKGGIIMIQTFEAQKDRGFLGTVGGYRLDELARFTVNGNGWSMPPGSRLSRTDIINLAGYSAELRSYRVRVVHADYTTYDMPDDRPDDSDDQHVDIHPGITFTVTPVDAP